MQQQKILGRIIYQELFNCRESFPPPTPAHSKKSFIFTGDMRCPWNHKIREGGSPPSCRDNWNGNTSYALEKEIEELNCTQRTKEVIQHVNLAPVLALNPVWN